MDEAELEDVLESVSPEHRKVIERMIVLLKDNPDVMEKIIYTVGGVIVGAFGGYGFGKNRNDD